MSAAPKLDEERRSAILTVATALFSRFGLQKTSMEEISRTARVSKATLYLLCDSKEELLFLCVRREVEQWVAALAKRIEPSIRASKLLERLSTEAFEYLEQRPLLQEFYSGGLALSLPQWREGLDELRGLAVGNIATVLRLGQKQGEFRDDIVVSAVAELLDDMQLATYVFHRHRLSPAARRARQRVALDLLVNGLR